VDVGVRIHCADTAACFVIVFDEAARALQESDGAIASVFFRDLTILCLFLHLTIRLIIAIDPVVLLRNLPDTALLTLSWSGVIPSLQYLPSTL